MPVFFHYVSKNGELVRCDELIHQPLHQQHWRVHRLQMYSRCVHEVKTWWKPAGLNIIQVELWYWWDACLGKHARILFGALCYGVVVSQSARQRGPWVVLGLRTYSRIPGLDSVTFHLSDYIHQYLCISEYFTVLIFFYETFNATPKVSERNLFPSQFSYCIFYHAFLLSLFLILLYVYLICPSLWFQSPDHKT